MAFKPVKPLEPWKKFGKGTETAVNILEKIGVSGLTESQLREIAKPMLATARNRVKALEREGLQDSPAYRYFKNNIATWSIAGVTNHNKLRHIIIEAYNFLNAKTSTVEGAKDFFHSTTERFIGRSATKEQREAVWDLYTRLEAKHPGYFTSKTYGSDQMIEDIYVMSQVLDQKGWDIDRAMEILDREVGDTLLFDDEIEDYTQDELGYWYDRLHGAEVT